MRKGNSIIGLVVISQSEGAALGHVKDLIFDYEANQLLGLLLSDKDLFGLIDAQVVPWESIRTIGTDAILVESNASKIKVSEHKRIHEVMHNDNVLSGTQILTSDGKLLGSFADLYIDEATGHVEGYEISTGFVSDTMSGKRFLPAPREIAIGTNVAIVPPGAAENMTEQPTTGLRAVAASVGSAVGIAYANVANASVEKQKEFVIGKTASRDVAIPRTAPLAPVENGIDELILVQQGEVITNEQAEQAAAAGALGQLLLAAAGTVAGEAYTSGREGVGALAANVQEKLLAAALGHHASDEVIAPDGSLVVEKGAIITPENVELARKHGREPDLIASAGLATAAHGVENVKEHAVSAWDAVRNKVAELTGNASPKKEAVNVEKTSEDSPAAIVPVATASTAIEVADPGHETTATRQPQ